MKRSKKRFTSEEQILKAIDKCHEESVVYYKMAEEWDKQADEMFRDGTRVEFAKEMRAAAKAKRIRAFNLVNKKAKYLGEKLPEFRTITMPTLVPDTSIQA
jgi:uncharacterized coiled-coil DUF342 family protein